MSINFSNLLDYCKKSKEKRLCIVILNDKRICPNIFSSIVCQSRTGDINTLKLWKKYFTKKSKNYKFQIKDDQKNIYMNDGKESVKKTTSKKILIQNLPVLCDFYNVTKIKAFKPDLVIYKKIFFSKYPSWDIHLILEKISNNKKVTPTWDNNDHIYVECNYLKPPKKLTQADLNVVVNCVATLLQKRGGGEFVQNNKSYVMSNVSKIVKKNFRFLSNLINNPLLINRTNYFNDILHNIDKFQVNRICRGIEYIIILDADKGKTFYVSSNFIDDGITPQSIGFCVLSAVKSNNKFIIRQVIIENGQYLTLNVKDLNSYNKKYGELLKSDYSTYIELTKNNYKKYLESEHKCLKKGEFIEFSKCKTPFYNNKLQQWSSKPEYTTFLCKKCPVEYIPNYPKGNGQLYLLYLTCTKSYFKYINLPILDETTQIYPQHHMQGFYFPLHFSPSTNPHAYIFWSPVHDLDNTYINLLWKNNKWEFLSKSDKTKTGMFGDDFKYTELNTWNYYRNPVTFKDLVLDANDVKAQMYFPFSEKKKTYEHVVKYNSFVKGLQINTKILSQCIDLASGKGQDLMRYRGSNIKKLLMIEIDKDAVDIILERKYQLFNDKGMMLEVLNANLNDPYKPNLQKIESYGINKVSQIYCFFALHYLTDTLSRVKNIVNLISSLLQKDGEFLYTSFDKNRVMEVLGKSGKWEINENGFKKYSIIKTGSRSIKLILPLNPEKYYKETLIDNDILDKEFKKCGMVVDKYGSFLDYMEIFKDKKPHLAKRMQSHDETFISMYTFRSYRKIK